VFFSQKITWGENIKYEATHNYQYISADNIEQYNNIVNWQKDKVHKARKREYLENLSSEELFDEMGYYYSPRPEPKSGTYNLESELKEAPDLNSIYYNVLKFFNDDIRNSPWEIDYYNSTQMINTLNAYLTNDSEQIDYEVVKGRTSGEVTAIVNTGVAAGTKFLTGFFMFTKKDEDGNILVSKYWNCYNEFF